MNQQQSHSSESPSYRQQIRREYRAKRQALTAKAQQSASEALLNNVKKHRVLNGVKTLALYLPNDGELDPSALIQFAWQHKIQTYLPVLHPFHKQSLLFLHYDETTQLVPNKYGIPEPRVTCPAICPLSALDMILTPLVAFDASGNRMGMGGGFYDRTLAHTSHKTTRIIGLAHDCQEMPQVPIENWDIPLQTILTPTRLIMGN